MSSGRRVILLVVLVVVAVFAGGAGAYWYFLVRSPFGGEITHDFGDIALHGETEEVHHTFHLTNRLSRPLTIAAIRPECGCLTARDVHQTLQPGEAFDLPITLIAKGGERVVIIHVVFDDDSVATLRVKAIGHFQPFLRFDLGAVALSPDGTAVIEFILGTYETDADPATPTVTTLLGSLRADFVDWKLRYRPKHADIALAPTEWFGRVRVHLESAAAAALPADAAITLNYGGAKPLTIPIRASGTADLNAPKNHVPTQSEPIPPGNG